MATYIVGFDGKWQESFDDLTEATGWAEEVAETGRVVEVVSRRFGFHKFVTGFPLSEREALRARWAMPWLGGSMVFGDGGTYGSACGGGGGGGGHGGGGHGHGGC
ncbi:MAG TPA: hypothetical protein VFI17_10765 [Solirubrobacterales bacterium]|nr:hypothetical protein [Solirubrobacterales bacterium]